MKLRRILALVIVFAMMVSTMGLSAFAEVSGNVAKVGNTEYATIDAAIAAWTNGTTLTLLDNVTLSDVINLSSTEYHVLDLSTYTMTAASKKDAINIVNNGRSSASYALDIKADAENPGGITASGKAIVRTAGKSGVKDRPIIRFYNGVFNASNIVYHSGSNGTNCPQFQFHGGVFNGTISTNRALNQFYGGTFTGSMFMSVDSSAYTLVAGGTFKNFSNMMGSALNSSKFTIGSAKGVYDKEVYVDDNGNYVIAASKPSQGIEAAVAKTPTTNDYLAYSKVATEGQLNYTDAKVALTKNNTTSAKVTVYADELDLSDITYKGTIVIPEGETIAIAVNVGTAPSFNMEASEGSVSYIDAVTKKPVILGADGSFEIKIEKTYVSTYDELAQALLEDGKYIVLENDIATTGEVDGTDANIDLNGKTLTLTVGGNNFYGNSVISNGKINITGCVAKGDCIIGVGDYSNSSTLTLDNVNIEGNGYSSAYAVLYVYNSSTLNINGGSVVVANDNASAGGVIKAHKAADGKINITGTASDPVELTFTDAKIGILDGTVVMDYVELDITGGANAINQSALTVKNSSLTIKDCDGRALTLSQGDVVIENSTLDFSGATEGEIRFKKALTLNVDANSTIKECNIWTSATGANVNGVAVTGTEAVQQEVTVVNGVANIGAIWDGVTISNVNELVKFRDAVNAGDTYSGKTVTLAADIDMSSIANWAPIGTTGTPFKGTFEGNNKTISNLKVNGTANQGFFGYADNAVIKNLKINNAVVTGTDCVGAVAGQVYSVSRIENCHVSGNIQITGQTNVGGITGKYYTKVSDSSVIGDGANTSFVKGVYVASDLEGDNIGGIMGHCGENNALTGNVVKNITVSGTRKVGGIVGIADQNTDVTGCTVENVVVKTTATAEYAASKKTSMSIGGLIGQYQAAGSSVDGSVANSTVTNVTFEIPDGVVCEAGAIAGGARGGTNGMLPPSDKITVSSNTVENVTGATNIYLISAVAKIGNTYYATLQEAIIAAKEGETVAVENDFVLTTPVEITKAITLDLNGKVITGKDDTSASFGLFNVKKGNLTVKDSVGTGKITLAASVESQWNRYSSVISNQQGTVTVESGTIEHLGGTSMSYAIDNLTNGSIGDATLIINGGLVKSTYRAIRQFANSTTNENNLKINGGTVEGNNKAVWLQSANAHANKAALAIEGGNIGVVYVDAESDVSQIAVNVKADYVSEVVADLPEGYIIEKANGAYGVVEATYVAKIGDVKYETLQDALKALTATNNTITILDNITINSDWDNRNTGAKINIPVIIEGNGKTIKFNGTILDGYNYLSAFRFESDATVKDLTFDMSEAVSGFNGRIRAISSKGNLTVDNCSFIGNPAYGNTRAIIFGEGAGAATGDVTVSITNSTFKNWTKGISDNENAQDAKSVTITGNTLENADVVVSAYNDVTFNNNSLTNGWVNIKSYTAGNALNVVAKDNTLAANDDIKYNVINAGGAVEAQDGFLIPVATIGRKAYYSLEEAIEASVAGDEIVVLSAVTLNNELTLTKSISMSGASVNANQKLIVADGVTLNAANLTGNYYAAADATVTVNTPGAYMTAQGNLTFVGENVLSGFSAGYYNRTITIDAGNTLKVLSSRMTVSYGNIINITGNLANAKATDKATVTPSLELVGGISYTGNSGNVQFNVKDAYVKLGDSTTKNSAATGAYNMSFDNSIVDFTKTLKTYMPTASGLDPVFNLTAKDSVVNFASHLELWLSKTNAVIDNTDLTVAGSFANAGKLDIINGSNFVVKAPIMSSHGGNTGTITVDGAKFELVDSNQDWENAGTIKVTADGLFILNDYTNINEGSLVIDAADLAAGASATVITKGNGAGTLLENMITVVNGENVTVTYGEENGAVIITKAKAPTGKVSYRAYVNDSSDREAVAIDMENIFARESLVVKLYDKDNNLLTTTTLKAGGVEAANYTCNIVLWGRASGSWDTVINAEKLTVNNIPEIIEIICDDIVVDTFTNALGMGTNVDQVANYKALDCVVKPVAKIGDVEYFTLQEAVNAAVDGDVIELLAGAVIEEGRIAFPATFKNITIKGNETSVIKNSHINSADGSSVAYEGITIDGVNFDNSYILMTGWRTNGASYKDWTIKNCTFKNINNTTNTAAIHFNLAETEPALNIEISGNVIDSVLGGSKSGIYLQATGDIKVENNVINNVSFRPYVIQLTVTDGIADNFVVTGNTFSGSAAGRAQGLANSAEGTDSVNLVVSGNIFKDITTQQICYWNFNAEKTTTEFAKNYYDIDIEANPAKIYYNAAASDVSDLLDYGIYPVYKELNADGTLNEASLYTPVLPVAKIGEESFTTLDDALNAASAMTGDVVVEILDKVTLDKALTGSYSSIKFVGTTETAEIYLDVQGYITATGKKVAFEDLKLSKVTGGYIANAGFMNLAFGVFDVAEVTYTNCIFLNGAYASSGDVTFTGCTFYRSHDRYGLWAYGDVDAVVDGCTFADIRGVKMYAEGGAKTVNLTVKNTDFTAADNKPAIVLTYGESVTLENNTYSSAGVFELDLDGAPNGTPVTSDKPGEITCKNDNGACGVLVDGKIYTTVAQAAEVAVSGSVVTLLHNSAETVELAEGVILDKNGYTADGVTVKVAALAKIGEETFASVAKALEYAKAQGIVDLEIVLIGETDAKTTDVFNLYTQTAFNSITFKQEDTTKPYYIAELDTGSRTNNGKFVFDGVNIIVTVQYIFEGNVNLTNNSIVKSVAEHNCFQYCSTTTVEPGSKLFGVIDDYRGGKVVVDGGRADGQYNTDADMQNAIMVINWSGDSLTLKNGAYFKANSANEIGRLTVNPGATLNVYSSKAEAVEYITNNGTINTDVTSSIATKVINGNGKIIIDAANFDGADVNVIKADMSGFTGTVEVTGNSNATYEITSTGLVVKYVPTPVSYVAKIGDNQYESLQAAFDAAGENAVITLIDDVSIDKYAKLTADKKVTLDLAGYTIDGIDKTNIAIMSYGDLTIKDSSDAKTGTIKSGKHGNLNSNGLASGNAINICGGNFVLESGNVYSVNNAFLIDEEVANVTINGGTITAEPATNNSAAFYISSAKDTVLTINDADIKGYNGILLWNNTTVNINGGTINAEGRLAIQGNGSKDNTIINIAGGTITGKEAAIYHPQGGELNITAGSITGETGIIVKGGKVNISGGAVTATGAKGDYEAISSGFKGTGDALYVEHYDNSASSENYGTPVVNVTGGTFVSANAKAVASYANPANNVEAITGFISGGIFSSDVSGLCKEGFAAELNADGTYSVTLAPEGPQFTARAGMISGIEYVDEVTGQKKVRIILLSGIDSLDYAQVGFKVTVDGETHMVKTSKVFLSAKVKFADGTVDTLTPDKFGEGINYIFGESVNFPEEFKGKTVEYTPFAIVNEGDDPIYGNATVAPVFPNK